MILHNICATFDDNDNDNLPDGWESLNGLNTNIFLDNGRFVDYNVDMRILTCEVDMVNSAGLNFLRGHHFGGGLFFKGGVARSSQ